MTNLATNFSGDRLYKNDKVIHPLNMLYGCYFIARLGYYGRLLSLFLFQVHIPSLTIIKKKIRYFNKFQTWYLFNLICTNNVICV